MGILPNASKADIDSAKVRGHLSETPESSLHFRPCEDGVPILPSLSPCSGFGGLPPKPRWSLSFQEPAHGIADGLPRGHRRAAGAGGGGVSVSTRTGPMGEGEGALFSAEPVVRIPDFRGLLN